MVRKKRGNYIIKSLISRSLIVICIFVLIFLIFLGIKYSGYAISTISKVTVHNGIMVIYNNFSGDTTDFFNLNDSQLADIENMTLEIPIYGKIIFSENVNLTKDAENNIVDLDSNVYLLNNSVKINTTRLTSLQVPARLFLYNLNFTNPQILKNGEVCPSFICQKINYSEGTLIFDIIGFYSMDEYSAREMINEPEAVSSGGGGQAVTDDFSLDKDVIKVSLIQGQIINENLTIKNNRASPIDIEIGNISLSRFMVLSQISFLLGPKESKTININIFAKENDTPDSYFGNMIVSSKKTFKSVNVIIDLKAKKPVLGISTSVIDKNLIWGEKVRANITLTNEISLKYIGARLYYSIEDFNQNIIISKEETVAIEKELELEREFTIPKNMTPGNYLFYAKVVYENNSAASADVFRVLEIEGPINTKSMSMILLIVIIIIIISLFIILILVRRYLAKVKDLSLLKYQKNEK